MAGKKRKNLMSLNIIILGAVWANFLKPVSAQDGCQFIHLPETVLNKIVEASDATLSLYKRDPLGMNEEKNSITDEKERTNSNFLQETTAKLSEDISMLREDLQTLKGELQSVKELRGTWLSANDHDAIQRQISSISQYKESTQQQLQLLSSNIENIFLNQQLWLQNKFENILKFQEDFVTELQNLKERQENSLIRNQNEIYTKLESLFDLHKETQKKQGSRHEKIDNGITTSNNETHNQVEAMLQAQKETGNKLKLLLEKMEVIPCNSESQNHIDIVLNKQKMLRVQHIFHIKRENEVIPSNNETRNNIVEILELQHEIRHEVRNISSHLDTLEDKKLQGENSTAVLRPHECSEIHQNGKNKNGVYTIFPDGDVGEGVRAYCENEWTVIVSRRSVEELVDFNKSWIDYKEGIGDPETEHWIGNEVLHKLTQSQPHKLQVEMEGRNGEKLYALYDTFSVADETNNYRLQVGGYSGNDWDYMGGLDNDEFSTPDRDNDLHDRKNCAERFSFGFWFKKCNSGMMFNFLSTRQSDYFGEILSRWQRSYSTIQKIIFKIKPATISSG